MSGPNAEGPLAPRLNVGFALYDCGCTILAEDVYKIPNWCPEHDRFLVDNPIWVDTDRPLGRTPGEPMR